MLRVQGCEGKNKMTIIDGVKTKARKARVERNKRLLINHMIVFDPRVYLTKKEFMATAYDDKLEVIDKNRDFVDAMDYAEMSGEIFDRFNYVALTKEQSRRNAEKEG